LEPRLRRLLGEEIGVVLSGSTAVSAPITVSQSFANRIREDLMVAVYDPLLGDDAVLLGVVRYVTRYEPFLRRGAPNVYVTHPQALDNDVLDPFTNAYVEFYGLARLSFSNGGVSGSLEPPVYPPHPGSRVYLLDKPSLLEAVVGGGGLRVGRHPFTGWEPPLDPEMLKMHVGVFGATGVGKSRLVRRLAREASRHYSVIIFDHSGVDYAPAAVSNGYTVVRAEDIRLDVITMAEVLVELMDVPSSLEDYVLAAVYCHDGMVRGVFQNAAQCLQQAQGGARRGFASTPSQSQHVSWSKDDFARTLTEVARMLNARTGTLLKLRLYAERVPDYIYASFGRRSLDASDVLYMAFRDGLVVVDMSGEEEIVAKRAIIARIVDEAWSIIHDTLEPINLAIFVDEAQHYACEHCRPSAPRLERIAREGRKWGFWLLVASQRVARDIKPGIRGNLGTIFFSRLQASTDLQELGGYLDLGNVTQASLSMLARRQFYVAGLANPLRKPLLIEVSHVPDNGF